MARVMALTITALAIAGCRTPEKIANDPATSSVPDAPTSAPPRTHVDVLLDSVRTADIQYATFRPPGSPFITLGRRMVVVAPPDAVELSHTGEVRVLDALVPLLLDEKRAFAAEVMLRAMMGDEPLGLGEPASFSKEQGQAAHAAWSKRLAELRSVLVWNAVENHFARLPANDAG
jgi:hypothetical protein